MGYKIGDKVTTGSGVEMEVYEETSSTGEKYLALRHFNERTGGYDIFNGSLSYYEQGFWGGLK